MADVTTVIYRKRCKPCRLSFSLLPDFLLPGSCYDRHFIVAWLWAWLKGATCRSRAFLQQHGVQVADDDRMSWSDRLDTSDDIRPRHQQLHRWSRIFTARAKQALPTLVAVAGLLNARVAAGLTSVAEFPARAGSVPLLQALGLFVAAERASNTDTSVDLQRALFRLVGYLTVRPPPSHKMRRASWPGTRYYGLVI
jgi:hypothetical protein